MRSKQTRTKKGNHSQESSQKANPLPAAAQNLQAGLIFTLKYAVIVGRRERPKKKQKQKTHSAENKKHSTASRRHAGRTPDILLPCPHCARRAATISRQKTRGGRDMVNDTRYTNTTPQTTSHSTNQGSLPVARPWESRRDVARAASVIKTPIKHVVAKMRSTQVIEKVTLYAPQTHH